ncbi:hypothetical protein ACPL_3416 [Actinoplanes sp. SE50/110]|nr:hypothetical protein ACPL_3416 [Actinoplanes sp. SE50/110]
MGKNSMRENDNRQQSSGLNEIRTPESSAVGELSRTPKRRRRAVQMAGGVAVGAGLLVGLVGMPAAFASAGSKPPHVNPTSDPGDPVAPNCTSAKLKITMDPAEGATGHSMARVHFRNNGTTCWFRGYPSVVAYTASGAKVPVAQTPRGFAGGQAPGSDEISPLLLEKGDVVSAVVEALNAGKDGRACTPVTKLKVSPPHQSRSATVAWSGGCADFQVHPAFRGTTGQES